MSQDIGILKEIKIQYQNPEVNHDVLSESPWFPVSPMQDVTLTGA